jgi:hypothetical protein
MVCEQHPYPANYTWTPLSSRPNYSGHTRWICGPNSAGRKSCMCRLCTPLCVAQCTQCRDKQRGYSKLGSRHVGTIALVSAECFAHGHRQSGDTESDMACALGLLAMCPEIQTKSTGYGPIGLEGRLTCGVCTLARGSLAFEACASPGVKTVGSFQSTLARAFIWPTANGTAPCHHGP